MGDSKDSTPKDGIPLTGWAIVNSQGELLPADADSDTSESSIEVVSVENNEVVSFHQVRKERIGHEIEQIHGQPESLNQQEASGKLNTETSFEKQTVNVQDVDSQSKRFEREEHETQGDMASCSDRISEENLPGKNIETAEAGEVQYAEGSQIELHGRDKDVDLDNKICMNIVNDPNGQQTLSLDQSVHPALATVDVTEALQNLEPGRSGKTRNEGAFPISEISPEHLYGACCKELSTENERSKVEDGNQVNRRSYASLDAAVTKADCNEEEEEEEMPNPLEDSGSEVSSDSDFVRLDPENIEDFRVNNQEAHMQPVLLHRSRSSIGENFRFMEAQEVRAHNIPPPPAFNNEVDETEGFDGDIDRDDETESSTEEGIDDRIESEQSEAGSHPAVNDVGDLSAFADIGDIPLVVGDVRRNYIHRPNNHLSSVLNLSLLLAAILTTGISLGIIMATDLEIEEWQNAYELQTMRVKQLESQLREKNSLLEEQDANIFQLKDLSKQLKLKQLDATDKTLKYQKMEKALDLWEALGKVEGGHFSQAANHIRGIIHVLTHCEEGLASGSTESDNVSSLHTNVCSNQLNNYIIKLRALAESPPFTGNEVSSIDKESLHRNILDDAVVEDKANVENQGVENKEGSDRGPLEDEETAGRDAYLNFESFQADGADDYAERRENQGSKSERQSISAIQDQGVVDMDIHQLQQSLSREQERALHWQHLYLSERRQRERERENEEWEDERDREEWEKERKLEREKMETADADLTELECLKKILASNLTTLTQNVTKWNVSVFDDFANLSILLSSVQDLKQSVVDSLSRVWDGAEKVLERMDTGSGTAWYSESIWDKGFVLRSYLLQFIDSIRQNNGPQLEMLLSNFRDNLEKIKKSFENVRQEMNSDSVNHWLERAWNVTEDIIGNIQNDVGKIIPEKEVLIAHLKNLCDSLEMKYEEFSKSRGEEEYGSHRQEQSKDSASLFRSDIDEDEDYRDWKSEDEEEDDDEDDEEEEEEVKSDDDDYDEEEDHKTFRKTQHSRDEPGWSSGISNILSRTHRSFQQLGQKVTRTFGEIKSIWRKKDRPLVRIAKHLTSKFMRASVKLTKMCTKLPATLFKGNKEFADEDQILIYSKCTRKLRKRWQKQLLKNPCDAAGMLSPECNMERKMLKKELKEVSKLFSQLLRIKTFQPEEALKLSREDATLHHELFKSFLERWGGKSMLLKKDLEWVACQRDWWSQVLVKMMSSSNEGNKLIMNGCDIRSNRESFFPGGPIEQVNKQKMKKQKKSKTAIQDDEEGRDFDDYNEKLIHHENSNDQERKMNISELGENAEDKASSDSDWHTNQAKYYKRKRRSEEKNHVRNDKREWQGQSGESEIRLKKRKLAGGGRFFNEDQDQVKNEWFFEKAQHREHQRGEHSRSEWLFERAKHRRHDSWDREDQEQGRMLNGKRRYLKENWILKQGHYRQHQREEEHRADWVFDRAADRKEHHNSALLGCNHPKHFEKGKHNDKYFRCAYGKVSTP